MKTITTCLGFVLSTLVASTAMAAVTSGELIKSYLAEKGIESKVENSMLIFQIENVTIFVRDLANNYIIKILVPSYVSGLDPSLIKRECDRLNNEMAVLKFLPNDGYVAISYEGLIPESFSTRDIEKIMGFLVHSERMLQQVLRSHSS